MNELPKIVTERLAATGRGTLVHPDANLLSAFAEHATTAKEQREILAHLGICAGCRDVVALIASAPAPAHAPLASPSRAFSSKWSRAWWALPVFACILAAAIGLLLHPELFRRTPGHAVELAQTAPATVVVAAPQAGQREEAASAGPQRGPVERPGHEKQASRAVTEAPAHIPAKDKAQIAGNRTAPKITALPASPAMTARASSSSLSVAPAPPVAMNSQPPATTEQENTLAAIRPASGEPQQPPSSAEGQTLSTTKPTFIIGPSGMRPMRSSSVSGLSFSHVRGHNVAGFSQSPLIPPSGAAANSTGEATAFGSGVRLPGKFALHIPTTPYQQVFWSLSPQGKLLRKSALDSAPQEVQLPPAATTLRAVAARGTEVWVGGAGANSESSGLLLHSTDSGDHWQQIAGPWMGAVVGLQLTGTQPPIITLRTASEEWQSPDAGITWSRLK